MLNLNLRAVIQASVLRPTSPDGEYRTYERFQILKPFFVTMLMASAPSKVESLFFQSILSLVIDLIRSLEFVSGSQTLLGGFLRLLLLGAKRGRQVLLPVLKRIASGTFSILEPVLGKYVSLRFAWEVLLLEHTL